MRNKVNAAGNVEVMSIRAFVREGKLDGSRRRIQAFVRQARAQERNATSKVDALFGSAGSWDSRYAYAWVSLRLAVLEDFLVDNGIAERRSQPGQEPTVGEWVDAATAVKTDSHNVGEVILSDVENSAEVIEKFGAYLATSFNEANSAIVRHNSTNVLDVLTDLQSGILLSDRISVEDKVNLVQGWQERYATVNPSTGELVSDESGSQIYGQEILLPFYEGDSLDIWADNPHKEEYMRALGVGGDTEDDVLAEAEAMHAQITE